MAPSSNIPAKTGEKLRAGFHLQILFKNHISGKEEPKATISSLALVRKGGEVGTEPHDVLDVKLSDLRAKLGKKLDKKWSFSLESGAGVDEGSGLCYYITLLPKNSELLKSNSAEQDKSNPAGSKADAPTSPPLFTVFVAVENAMAPRTAEPSKFVSDWASNNKPDITLPDRSKEKIQAPNAPTSYKADYVSAGDFKSAETKPTDPGMLDCVVDFADGDWHKLNSINKTLYAFDVRGKKLEVVSARLPAFELNVNLEASKDHLREFAEICDTPSIEITEVSSDFQSSLVNNAFSSRSVEAMVGGGTPMVSASVSAGVKTESEKGSGSSEGNQRKEYHATYNFPRVKLFLDETTLQVSDGCKAALLELQANQTLAGLIKFQSRFGVIFAQSVTLGGRLQSTRAAHASFNAANSSEREALKTDVGAAVSYGVVNASVKVGTEDQRSRGSEESRSSGDSMVSFTARGGDTLLCASPTEWASTVAVWRNWRVIQQDDPVTLQALLGRFKGFEWVPALFEKILGPAKPVQPPSPPPVQLPPKAWDEKTMLRLRIDQTALPSMNASYSVRSGDPADTSAAPRKLLTADFPLFFFEGQTHTFPGRDASTVCVDPKNGEILSQVVNKGPCRFSLRKIGATGLWNPEAQSTITNGERVTLWCHSLDKGGWSSLSQPPSDAFQAYYNIESKSVRFQTFTAQYASTGGWAPAEFIVEFVS